MNREVADARKALRALALELPVEVHADVSRRVGILIEKHEQLAEKLKPIFTSLADAVARLDGKSLGTETLDRPAVKTQVDKCALALHKILRSLE